MRTLLAPLLLTLVGSAVADDRPNIVFIFTDDHSCAAISAYGSRINETPNIDRLAAEGMIFDQAFCTNGICAPSRAVILTGAHSHVNGVIDNGKRFDGGQITFPKLLQGAGYQTAIFGKWHLKTDPTGFDEWQVLPGQGHYYNPDLRNADGTYRVDGYCTDIVTDLSIQWLREREKDRPFLLMCQHKAPHRAWMPGPDHLLMYDDATIPEPDTLFDDYSGRGRAAHEQEMEIDRHMYMYYDLKVPPEEGTELEGADRWTPGRFGRMSETQSEAWHAAYDPRNEAFKRQNLTGRDLVRWKYQRYIKDYLRCIASVDDNIGRLIATLEEMGLAENTIIVYASDQGFYLGEHGWYDKRFMYEPSLRLPLIVRWPGVTESGTRSDDLVQNLDFAPTFLEAAGVDIPDRMQGESLAPLLRGDDDHEWRDAIYYQYYERGIHAVQPHYGVRTDRYKLMHFYEIGEWEMYDLESDPNELTSIYDDPSFRELRSQLHAKLETLRHAYGAAK